MKKLIVLFMLICATAFADNTNISYGGRAKLCIPMTVEQKLREFESEGGAVIYIVGTNSIQIDHTPIETNRLWKAEDFICTNYICPEIYWNADPISTNGVFSFDINKTHNLKTTWVYKDFKGKVKVAFDVGGYGISKDIKELLEEEIAVEIQKILDLHFPKDDK